jgi:hypothetical protein
VSMTVGKHCSTIWLYIGLAIIVLSLTYLVVGTSPNRHPKAVPIHQSK